MGLICTVKGQFAVSQTALFFVILDIERECFFMESNDFGDILLMLLDDDLFWVSSDNQEGENNVD